MIEEKPCWLCPDYVNEGCHVSGMIIKFSRPCVKPHADALMKFIKENKDKNPLAHNGGFV